MTSPLDPLLEELAARHAEEAAEVPAAADREGCLLVAVEPEREYFLLPEAGFAIPFGAVGGRELSVEGVDLDPAELSLRVDVSVAKTHATAGWSLHEVRIRPRGGAKGLAEVLASLSRLLVRIRSNADNAADFSLPVSFLLGRIRVEPPAVDLGRVAFFGDTLVADQAEAIVLHEAGRSSRTIPLAPGGRGTKVALGDGIHRIDLPGGERRTLAVRPFERVVRIHNDSLRPLRLEAEFPEESSLYVVPSSLEIAPGESSTVRVRFLPALATGLGRQEIPASFRLEVSGQERILPGRLQVPVRVDLAAERAVLSVETRSVDLGRRRLGQGDPRFIIPYRLVGKGKVRLAVRFEPDVPGLFELEKDYTVLRNKDDEITPGFLSVRIDAARWFARRLERFRAVVETDAYLANRRSFEVEGRLELVGLALAHREIRIECHQGLLYQIPLAVWAEEPPAGLGLALVGVQGSRPDLAGRLSLSEWHHLDALEAHVEEAREAARPPGSKYALHPACGFLLLDLAGLDEPDSIDADWILVLEEPSSKYRHELRISVRMHSGRAFLAGELLTRAAGRTRLEFEIANPTDRAFHVLEVAVDPVRFPGLAPFRVEPRVKIDPGRSRKFGLDLSVRSRGLLAGALDALLARRPTLRLSVRTDLPGGHAIERTIRFRRA